MDDAISASCSMIPGGNLSLPGPRPKQGASNA